MLGNTYFKHKNLHKYTRVTRFQNGIKVMSMIDLVLAKREILQYMHNVRTVREMGQGLSNHHAVCVKLGWWVHGLKGEVVNGGRRIRSKKLREYQYIEGYTRCLESKGVK